MSDTKATEIGEVTYSERGFKFLPALEDDRGTRIEVYESSAAATPHVWLRLAGTWLQLKDGGVSIKKVEDVDLTAHLSFELVDTLIEQLSWIRKHHYQEEWARNERSDQA